MDFIAELEQKAFALGLRLSVEQLRAFDLYRRALSRAAEKTNLTAVPAERYIDEHFVDSLTLFQTGKIRPGQAMADVGSGAGFPGLPVKIAAPDVTMHLIEANAKKTDFLKTLVAALPVSGVYVHQLRAETAARRPELRERMDVVTARAVAPLPVLLEYALPLLRLGGWFLAMKGPRVDRELPSAVLAADRLGGRIDTTLSPIGQPGGIEHVIVLVRKVAPTADSYPRRVGVPAKRPLGG
jgi:16S rRNA (guanine527-N7)-methyltransferase